MELEEITSMKVTVTQSQLKTINTVCGFDIPINEVSQLDYARFKRNVIGQVTGMYSSGFLILKQGKYSRQPLAVLVNRFFSFGIKQNIGEDEDSLTIEHLDADIAVIGVDFPALQKLKDETISTPFALHIAENVPIEFIPVKGGRPKSKE